MTFKRSRHLVPSHGTVVAYVALFVALGGTGAYAAATITGDDVVDESLTSADLLDEKGVQGSDVIEGSLESTDLKDGTGVNGIDVVNGSLATADLANNAVTGGKIAGNAITQPKISAGAVNTLQLASHAIRAISLPPFTKHAATLSVPASSIASKIVSCAPGEQIMTGGFVSLSSLGVQVYRSTLVELSNGWTVSARNTASTAKNIEVHAFCLPA
jgi:hypothetical protein